MSYSEELEQDLIRLRNSTESNVDELMRLSAIQARVRLFEHLRDLIQEKDSSNDVVAANVLAWAWEQLSDK